MKKSPCIALVLILCALLSSCLTLNTHSGIAEYARCFPAMSVDASDELLLKNGNYYIKAEEVNAMMGRSKIDGMIDLGPFAAPTRYDRIQSRKGTYGWLPISAAMAKKLRTPGRVEYTGDLVADINTSLKYRRPTTPAGGTCSTIAASLQKHPYSIECPLVIDQEWQERLHKARSGYYSPFGATAPLQPSGNYWARPAACLSAVLVDTPASAVLSVSSPIIVAVSLMCGYGPP